jgi:LmbE family N-acetylglucosaminyl deacetylase
MAPTKKIGNIEVSSFDLVGNDAEWTYSRAEADKALDEMTIEQHFATDMPGRPGYRAEALTAAYNGREVTYVWVTNGTKSQQRIVSREYVARQKAELGI